MEEIPQPKPPVPHKSENLSVPSAIIIAGVLVALSILYVGRGSFPTQPNKVAGSKSTTEPTPKSDTPGVDNMKPVSEADHIRGTLKSQLIIVEYSDLECPFCKTFHYTLQKILEEYGPQKVAWVYRNFPIPQLHSKAPAEAAAAECASVVGGNDAFWKFIDEVFIRTRSNDSLDLPELPKIAASIGINVNSFIDCVKSEQTVAKVTAESAEAQNAGARGTPYSIIVNTKTGKKTPIPGALPYEQVKQMVDDALAGR